MIFPKEKCAQITGWLFRNNPVPKPRSSRMIVFILVILISCCQLAPIAARAQDSTIFLNDKAVLLKAVVVRNNLNVADFIHRIQVDSSFYKAFKNLRIVGYTALNDIQMLDKRGNVSASLSGKTIQHVNKNCRWMEIERHQVQGDFYTRRGTYNYYTAELYANLFFASDTICGETNIVGDLDFAIKGKSGIARHKEQLKMLFFNPGRRIPGLPFIGNKIALFDPEIADLYDFTIDVERLNGKDCYVFSIIPRENLSRSEQNQIVIQRMVSWLDIETWEIRARKYDLQYRTAVYDFDVQIEVELTRVGDLLLPSLMRYTGNWDLAFKPRERGIFTATLSNFSLRP